MITSARAVERASPALPPALLQAVSETCRRLADAASGRVFEVPGDGIESALEAERASGARYDTILSFMCTPQVVSLEDYVAAIERILAEEGWIRMVEPARLDPGSPWRRLTGRLRRPARQSDRGRGLVPAARSVIGHASNRAPSAASGQDLVSAVRSGGLVVTDVHRREAASVPPEWRQYVVLRARRATPQPDRP